MQMKHLSIVALAVALTTMAASSAAVVTNPAKEDMIGAHDIRVTLQPGASYIVPLPATAYPGAPFTVTVVDPGLNVGPIYDSWIMKLTLSYFNGAVSWNGLNNGINTTAAGWAMPGETKNMDSLCVYKGGCAALLDAIPVGSGEGVRLSVPSGSYGAQSFIISIRGG
jgi:hypothetical protein